MGAIDCDDYWTLGNHYRVSFINARFLEKLTLLGLDF